MKPDVEKTCLKILADAVDRTVGNGFVHNAITRAAESLENGDFEKAGKAFQMLSRRESVRVRDSALEGAGIYRDFGEYDDPLGDLGSNPSFEHIRSRSVKLGTG